MCENLTVFILFSNHFLTMVISKCCSGYKFEGDF